MGLIKKFFGKEENKDQPSEPGSAPEGAQTKAACENGPELSEQEQVAREMRKKAKRERSKERKKKKKRKRKGK